MILSSEAAFESVFKNKRTSVLIVSEHGGRCIPPKLADRMLYLCQNRIPLWYWLLWSLCLVTMEEY